MRGAKLLVLLACLLGASCDERKGGNAGGSPPRRASEQEPPKAFPPTREVAAAQPPIRGNVTRSAPYEGVVSELRLFVSNITSDEPLRAGLRLLPATAPSKGDPWYAERIDGAKLLTKLRFIVKGPKGKEHVLELAGRSEPGSSWSLADMSSRLEIGRSSLGTLPWKTPAPDLFSEVGTHTLSVAGQIETDKRTIEVLTGPLTFEVKARGEEFKTVTEIEEAAASLVAKERGLAKAPQAHVPTVDDVEGNLWVSFRLEHFAKGSTGYDVNVIDVLLDRGGKKRFVDSYTHFTCVATGAAIATPEGERPVEELHVGDVVSSWDVATGVATTSVVEAIEAAHAERLVKVGRLEVTPSHPVWASGRWTPAGELARGAELLGEGGERLVAQPVPLAKAATVYALSVSPPHTYFAGGVLVHNKAVPVPLAPADAPFQGWFYRRAARRP